MRFRPGPGRTDPVRAENRPESRPDGERIGPRVGPTERESARESARRTENRPDPTRTGSTWTRTGSVRPGPGRLGPGPAVKPNPVRVGHRPDASLGHQLANAPECPHGRPGRPPRPHARQEATRGAQSGPRQAVARPVGTLWTPALAKHTQLRPAASYIRTSLLRAFCCPPHFTY